MDPSFWCHPSLKSGAATSKRIDMRARVRKKRPRSPCDLMAFLLSPFSGPLNMNIRMGKDVMAGEASTFEAEYGESSGDTALPLERRCSEWYVVVVVDMT